MKFHEDEAQIEYLPTQKLTKYIRLKGYDVVRYANSLTDGFNITLFCSSAKSEREDDWIVKICSIPIFSEWFTLKDFNMSN